MHGFPGRRPPPRFSWPRALHARPRHGRRSGASRAHRSPGRRRARRGAWPTATPPTSHGQPSVGPSRAHRSPGRRHPPGRSHARSPRDDRPGSGPAPLLGGAASVPRCRVASRPPRCELQAAADRTVESPRRSGCGGSRLAGLAPSSRRDRPSLEGPGAPASPRPTACRRARRHEASPSARSWPPRPPTAPEPATREACRPDIPWAAPSRARPEHGRRRSPRRHGRSERPRRLDEPPRTSLRGGRRSRTSTPSTVVGPSIPAFDAAEASTSLGQSGTAATARSDGTGTGCARSADLPQEAPEALERPTRPPKPTLAKRRASGLERPRSRVSRSGSPGRAVRSPG
jgi:hypothetical protein